MTGHPLILILTAAIIVAVLATGAVVYLGRRGYRLVLEPKVAPQPKQAPAETGGTS